jgi:hypothetical protein
MVAINLYQLLSAQRNVFMSDRPSGEEFFPEDSAQFLSPQQLLIPDPFVKPQPSSRSSLIPVNKLEYVHITKNAGTAIEAAANKRGISWGVCHFADARHCRRSTQDWARIPFQYRYPFHGEKWHTPPTWLEPNPYASTKTFTVVRNPYDRVISEYYCKYYGYRKRDYEGKFQREGSTRRDRLRISWDATDNMSSHDEWKRSIQRIHDRRRAEKDRRRQQIEQMWSKRAKIIKQLNETGREDSLNNSSPEREARRRLLAWRTQQSTDNPKTLNKWIQTALRRGINSLSGHMLPQHYYIFDINATQVIDHVLKYEQLPENFRHLMQEYNLKNVKLHSTERINQGHKGKQRRMTVSDLSGKTIALINDYFSQDFSQLGYQQLLIT